MVIQQNIHRHTHMHMQTHTQYLNEEHCSHPLPTLEIQGASLDRFPLSNTKLKLSNISTSHNAANLLLLILLGATFTQL